MPFTVTQSLARIPTFPELQALAGQHEVRISGNDKAGVFHHPGPEEPKVEGHYAFAPNGDIHGDFTGYVLGKLTGTFIFAAGNAEVTVTDKPFLLPEALLKSKLSEELKKFCEKFS